MTIKSSKKVSQLLTRGNKLKIWYLKEEIKLATLLNNVQIERLSIFWRSYEIKQITIFILA